MLVSYRPLGSAFPDWGLIAKLDSDEAYAPVARLRWLLLSLGGGLLLLGLGASNAIARRVARPIRHLARTSSAVAAGDLSARSAVVSSDEIGELSLAFDRMTDELARSHATLERRISERTRALEAVRDLLDAFFRISTSRLDPDNIDKTFDSVLRFCSELGYDLAMISLVDREAGVIRAVRAQRGHDRRGRPDGPRPRWRRHPGRRGPRGPRDRRPRLAPRPAMRPGRRRRGRHPRPGRAADDQRRGPRHPPGRHAPTPGPRPARPPPPGDSRLAHGPGPGRAPADRGDPPPQPEPAAARPGAGALRGAHSASRPGSSSRSWTAWATASSSPTPTGRFLVFNPAARRILGQGRIDAPARRVVPPLRGLPARSGHGRFPRKICP